jgi:MFS family permease
VIVDRVKKRSLLIVTQAAAAMLAGVLAFLDHSGHIQLWHVYAVGLMIGIVNAFDMPARQTFVVDMVGKEDLTNAIALNSSIFNAGRLVGPAIAGLLVAAFGTALCFAINGVSFLAVIIGLLMMRITETPRPRRENNLQQLRQGLAYIRTTPRIWLTIVLVGFVSSFGVNFNIWVPLLAKTEFNAGAGGFGILLSALGLGSLVGALTLALMNRSNRSTVMLSMACLLGTGLVALGVAAGFSRSILLGMAILPILGFAMTSTMSMANSTVQTASPYDLRGRVMSVYLMVNTGSGPFGALLVGAAANSIGTAGSIALGGAITLIAAIGIAVYSGALPTRTLTSRPPLMVDSPISRTMKSTGED